MTTYWTKQYKIRKLQAILLKGGKCEKCGYDKCIGALDFHHIDPKTKKFQWNKLRKQSKLTILEEIAKCSLLCANCHREEHFGQTLWDDVKLWRHELDSKKTKQSSACENCSKEYYKDRNSRRFCSVECSQEFIRKFNLTLEKPKKNIKLCERCNTNPVNKNGSRYCSYNCARECRIVTNWPDNLPELVANSSKTAVAKLLGVSDKAVAKRLKNHHMAR